MTAYLCSMDPSVHYVDRKFASHALVECHQYNSTTFLHIMICLRSGPARSNTRVNNVGSTLPSERLQRTDGRVSIQFGARIAALWHTVTVLTLFTLVPHHMRQTTEYLAARPVRHARRRRPS